MNDYYTIRSIRVISENKKTLAINGIDTYYGTSSLLFIEKEAISVIKRHNAYIRDMLIKKEYPGTITIYVWYYSPVAYIKTYDGVFLVAKDGRILEKKKTYFDDYPLLITYQKEMQFSRQIGSFIDENDVKTALYYIWSVTILGYPIKLVELKGLETIYMTTKDGRELLCSTAKNVITTEYEIKTILIGLAKEKKIASVIDVRFDKPIVRYIRNE